MIFYDALLVTGSDRVGSACSGAESRLYTAKTCFSVFHVTLLSRFCPAPTTSTSASAVGRPETSPAKQFELPVPGLALGTVQANQM